MALTIYQIPHSPYCIPLTRAFEALGLDFEVVNITYHTREEVIRATDGAYYQVPLLEHDGNLVMESTAESIDIARYVDRTFARDRLFPEAIEAEHIPLVREIEEEMELVGFKTMDPQYMDEIEDVVARTMIRRHKERKFGLGCVEQWRENRGELLEEFFGMLAPCETTLTDQPFLFGQEPVYADFALYGVLENALWKGWNSIPAELPELVRWRSDLAAFSFG